MSEEIRSKPSFAAPDISSACASIELYAHANNLAPEDVLDIFEIGLFAYTKAGKLPRDPEPLTVLVPPIFDAPTSLGLDMNVYVTEPHPIDGICLVLRLTKTRWSMDVYAPGVVPNPISRGGVISTYFSRPHGSAGIAVDTFIREGRGWRHKLPEMVKAEKAYAASSGSAIT